MVDGERWRIYNQRVRAGETAGWMQVVQELESVEQIQDRVLAQMVFGAPVALALAALGGYFLASRALRPIDGITRTAQAINASDLHQRIGYAGPRDKLGRLASTFDNMLARLQAAFERERRFTGDAAHELRTPLTILKGRIGVTLSQPRRPAEYVDTLQDMEQQVDRLIRLSSDLLFMARLDKGQNFEPARQIELSEFLAAILDQVRPLADAKSISVTESIPAGLSIHGHVDLLIRLFLNLLDNAVKYTPAGGRVTLQAHRQGRGVQVAISDTGPGIAAVYLPHLFERFYRVEGDRARRPEDHGQGGAGLGLAIAYEIARAHGGSLAVQSEAGRGTTFVAQLPA